MAAPSRRGQAGQPDQQEALPGDCRRQRPRRGAAAAASRAELGYQVDCFTFTTVFSGVPIRWRAGGINAAKNYRNDGDGVERLFRDTLRAATTARAGQRLPAGRDQQPDHRPLCRPGHPIASRLPATWTTAHFGGAQVTNVLCPWPDRPAVAARRLRGSESPDPQWQRAAAHAYRDAGPGGGDGRATGIIGPPPDRRPHRATMAPMRWFWRAADTATSTTLSTNALASNVTATFRAYRRGAWFANPGFTQIHPTCIPAVEDHQSKLT